MTASPSARTSSCMNTVSAPAGIGAPVKMRMAWPAPIGFAVGAAGGQPSADREPGLGFGREIAVPHRIAIDGRIVERRQIDRRDDVAGEHAPARRRERHAFGLGHRLHALGDHPLHVGDRQQRAGEGKAVVGELRHHALCMAAAAFGSGTACLSRTSTMPSMSFRSITGTFGARQRRVAGDGDDVRIVRLQQRLAVGHAMNFELRKRIALEAFDQHEIDRGKLAEQVGQVPFRVVAQLMQDGEALGRADDHLGRAGGAVHERVLARLVEVEAVMRVLDRRHPAAARDQARQRLGDQRGLARAAPAGESDDAHGLCHGLLIAKTPGG